MQEEMLYESLFGAEKFGGRDCEIMQYTGLKDKNGKEIYEGDIVRAFRKNRQKRFGLFVPPTELKLEVYWDSEFCAFKIKYHKMGWSSLFGLDEPYEIIGNIYENSDLIK